MTGPVTMPSWRWTIGLLIALTLVLAVGGSLLVVMISRPQRIWLEISAPVGEEIYYDTVLDGVASSGVATLPATLSFEGRRFSFAVIPKRSTASDLDLSLHTPHAGGTHRGPGVTGTFSHSALQSQMALKPMTPTHVANMRRSREAARRQETSE